MAATETAARRGPDLTEPCTVTGDDAQATVTVTGVVDRSTVAAVRNRLLHAAKAQPARLTVDLDRAVLADGSAVAVLVELWQFACDHSIELAVRTPAASVRQVFDLGAGGRVDARRS